MKISDFKLRKIRAFTLSEALIFLLITSLFIVATMPVITKKNRRKVVYKRGPDINKELGKLPGWTCEKKDMPCNFNPPVNDSNFMFYYDNNPIPSFATNKMSAITIVANCTGNIVPLYKSMDEYKKGHPKLEGTYCAGADTVRVEF